MKKDGQLTIRFQEDLKDEFRQACEAANTTAAVVIRDLCVAAIPYMTKLGRWVPPKLAEQEASTERLRDMMIKELVNPDSPLHMVMETIVERTNARKHHMLAADARSDYGGAGAGSRTQVITPPAVRGARPSGKSRAGAVEADVNPK